MKKRKWISDVVNLHIVGDHVTLQPALELFSNIGRRIDPKGFCRYGNKNVRFCLAFRSENACLNGGRFTRLAEIICDLPIKEPKSVRAGNTKLCALGKVEENRLSSFGTWRHSFPDDNRLSSCLKKPGRNRVVSLLVPLLVTLINGPGDTSGATSCWLRGLILLEFVTDSLALAGSSCSTSCNSSSATGEGSCKYFRATTE